MLILSMNVPDWPPGQFPRSGVSWLRPRKAAGHLLGLFSEGAIDEASAALLHGLPAAFPARQAPPWLEAAAERLAEGPAGLSISKLARHAGIHQAHFSRAFSRHFGLSPIMFRRRAMAAHALSTALSEGAGFADAAAAAGFTDQSHMSRAVVEACGLTPGRIRRLLQREAISIQSGKELVR
jgi:AraC-like DNA-binding protein